MDRLAATLCLTLAAAPALSWDADGHRSITLLALDAAAAAEPALPAFFRDEETRQRIAWQSGEPDRWRGTRTPALTHENNPDHYIDVEDLEPFGLTLETVSPLRYEYLRAMVVAKHEHPERMGPYNEATDLFRTQEFPGFLPHAIAEHADKLRSHLKTLRILEGLPDASTPRRQAQVRQSRENAIATLGLLSHFVGDAAQPLHTTRHHHGWVGDNPDAFTTDRGFHAHIDGGVIRLHALSYDALRAHADTAPITPPRLDPGGQWDATLDYIRRSFERVRPLYELEKSGELEREPGRAFITERMTDAAGTLAGLLVSAWNAGEPSPRDIEDHLRYEAKE
jgi:hypothetical protein